MASIEYDDLILGGMLNGENERWLRALHDCQPEHFVGTHKILYELASRYYRATGYPLDYVRFLDMAGALDPATRITLEAEFTRLWWMEVPEGHYRWAIKAIVDKRRDETLIATLMVGMQAMTEGVGGEQGYEAARKKIMEGLGQIDRHFAPATPYGNIRLDAAEVWKDYEAATLDHGVSERTVMTGLAEVDRTITGLRPGENMLVAAYSGEGKAQPLDAQVLTPAGYVPMGSLQVGDALADPDGGTSKVLGVFPQGTMPVYRVTFSDGTSTEATGDHLWLIDRSWAGKVQTNVVVTTDQLAKHSNARLPRLALGDLDHPGRRPLDPYVLGALLGDGSFRNVSTPSITSGDPEIPERVGRSLPYGNWMTTTPGKNGRLDTHRIVGQGVVAKFLEETGLAGAYSEGKFVPPQYLFNNKVGRLELLRGLMDTDGSAYAETGQMDYTSVSKQLAEDVAFLVRSLGGRARIGPPTSKSYTHRGEVRHGKPAYRVAVSFSNGVVPFTLKRKAERVRQVGRARVLQSIEYVRDAPCQCIKVSAPSETYITDDLIRTHNTTIIQNMAWHAVVVQRKNVLVMTNENQYEQYRARIYNRHAHHLVTGGLPYNEIRTGSLSPEQANAWHAVCADFGSGDYGRLEIVQMPTHADMTWVVATMERYAQEMDVDLAVLDYIGRMSPMVARTQRREELNDSINLWASNLVGHNHGQGVPGITGYQIGRVHWAEAQLTGRYGLNCLAETSEAERNAAVVVTNLRKEGVELESSIQVPKCRDGATLEPTPIRTDFSTTLVTSAGQGGWGIGGLG